MGTRIPLSKVDTEEQDLRQKLEMSTAEIGLSVRTTNCLEERGIFTVKDLLERKPRDLLAISNFGEKTLEEVYKALEGIGFYRPSKRKTASPARVACEEAESRSADSEAPESPPVTESQAA